MFCSRCGSMMFPSKGDWECRRCGHKKKIGEKDEEKVREKKEEKETLIIDGKLDTLPRTKTECPSCGNPEAYWVMRQTRASDEPETRIYRCTKCAHTWREF